MRRERVAYMVATIAALNKQKRVSPSSGLMLNNQLASGNSKASSITPNQFSHSALTAAISHVLMTGVVISATAISMTMLTSVTAQAQPNDFMRQDCEDSQGKNGVDCDAKQALPSSQAAQVADNQVALADISDEVLLNQALDALHLKKAVEEGTVDASVLEQYQQETLKQRDTVTSIDKNSVSKNSVNKNTPNKNDQSTSASTDTPSQPTDQLADNRSDNEQIASVSESELAQEAQSIQQEGYQMMSPEDIDSQLGVVDEMVQRAASFDAPVARLDSKEPPLGLDQSINAAVLPTPTNLETLGLSTADEPSTDANSIVAESMDAKNNNVKNINAKNNENNVSANNVTQSRNDKGIGSSLDHEPRLDPSIAARPIEVSDSVSSGSVTTAEDITDRADPKKLLANQASNKVKAADQEELIDSYTKAAKEAGQSSSQVAKAAVNKDRINPDDYLPDYQAATQTDAVANSIESSTATKPKRARNEGNIIKRLYNRYFNDGYSALPRVEASIYLEKNSPDSDSAELIKADNDSQPINNIKASLEDITVQSIEDFTAALPRLRQTALNAAKAVGYYDVTLRLQKTSDDQIDVIIEKLGEPVTVDSRILDVRGAGGETPEYQALETALPPQKGDIFNHGVYKSSKATLEALSSELGYFDQYWLNKSVDIILPDNTADVNLIYNTGDRYEFDDVVFFTYDAQNNELTTDPDKLPVKPELLRQLLGFDKGDPYYRPKVTKLSNDLSATRYFNTVNVEVIMPSDAKASQSTLAFDSSVDGSDEQSQETLAANANLADDVNVSAESKASAAALRAGAKNKGINSDTDSGITDSSNGATLSSDNSVNTDRTNAPRIAAEDIAPINFEVDEQTHDKMTAISQKAKRLASLPDNRVLDEKDEKAKNLLGKISDSISGIAKKILPDGQEEDLTLRPEKLANRQTPEEVKQSKKIPLYVYVASEKPRDAQAGIGYGTDTGIRATARVDYNLINRDGYQAGFEVAASRINKNATIYAKRPWKHPLNDTLDASLTYEEKISDEFKGNFDLSTQTLKASLARNIHPEAGWDRTYSLRYRLDKLETSLPESEREDIPVQFTSSNPTQQALLLGYGISKLDVDNITNPTKGLRQYYGIEAGAKGAVTDTNMVVLHAGANGIYTFGEDNRHQVLGKLSGGYLWADDFYQVPYRLRFFAGGDQSIRGFDYESLSPVNEKGYLTGGQILAVGSAEYNYEFKPGFRAAVFADVGNAYDKDFKADTNVGVGAGIRWASPIGVVRIDVAAGVTEKDDIPIRLHFFIGSPL
ncbi:MAG: BamA/TamA family outer membrane protein [Psychrobacter sp.]|nr:BamA/TamA family outer membrane protein [Psychrobacter sp.]